MQTFKKFSIIFFVLLNGLSSTKAQWIAKQAGQYADFTTAVDYDASGNVYATGYFNDTAYFGTSYVVASGSADVFVAKYNSTGTLQWVKSYGDVNYERANDISVDVSGNIYLTGRYENKTVFGSTTLNSIQNASLVDMFVAKLDNSGKVLWAKTGGSKNWDYGRRVKTDKYGNVYVTGGFGDDQSYGTDLDTGFYGSLKAYGLGGSDAVIVKYNKNGKELWVNNGGGTGFDQAFDLDIDGFGYPIMCGTWYADSAGAPATFGKKKITGHGDNDLFVCKLDTSSGSFLWAKGGGSITNDLGYGVASDKSGNVYTTGFFGENLSYSNPKDSAQFDTLPYIYKKGGKQMFVAKFNASGVAQWVRQGGGEADDLGYDIAMDINQNVVVIGTGDLNSKTFAKKRDSYFGETYFRNIGMFAACYTPIGKVNYMQLVTSKDSSNVPLTIRTFGKWNAISGYFLSNGITINGTSLINSGSYDGFTSVLDTGIQSYLLPVTVKNNQLNLCITDTVYLTAPTGYSKYQWYKDSSFLVETTSNVKFFTTTGNYRVTAITSNGYAYSSALYKVIQNLPNPVIQASGATTFCSADSLRIHGDYLAGVSINWTKNGSTIPGATDSFYYAKDSGNYVQVFSTKKCSAVQSNAIQTGLYPTPSNSITAGGNTTFCDGDSVILSATNNKTYSYSWMLNGTTITGASTYSYVAKKAGKYSVKVSTKTCSANSKEITVTVNALPDTAVSVKTGKTTFCIGDSVVFSVKNVGGNTYQWKLNGNAINGATTSTLKVQTSGVYSVTIKNAAGCSNTSGNHTATSVTYPDTTVSVKSGKVTFCTGDSVVFSVPSLSGNKYQWRKNGTTISGATKSSYSAKQTGVFSVYITNATGCADSSGNHSATSVSYPDTAVAVQGKLSFCTGDSVILTAVNVSGFKYQWRNKGKAISGATGSSFTAKASGVYTVYIVNPTGCADSSGNHTVTSVTFPDTTVSIIYGKANFCIGDSVIFSVPNLKGNKYQWKKNGVVITGATKATYAAKQTGLYSVYITNATGCADSSGKHSVTSYLFPDTSVSVSGKTTFCSGDSVSFSATNVLGNKYQWRLNGVAISGANGSKYSATTSGDYSVYIINPTGCADSSGNHKVSSITYPDTAVSISYGKANFCSGDSVTFSVPNGKGNKYQWRNNGVNISGATSSKLKVTQTGVYSVFIINSSGCADSSGNHQATVIALPDTTVSTSGNTSFCKGDSVLLSVTKGIGNTYQWKKNGISIQGEVYSSINAKTNGTYSVVVTNSNGCSNTSGGYSVSTFNLPDTMVQFTYGKSEFCQGDSVILSVPYDSLNSYEWRNNGIAISGETFFKLKITLSGTYSVMVKNKLGCQNTSGNHMVKALAYPDTTLTIKYGKASFCVGDSVVLSVPKATGVTYQWRNNGNPISGENKSTLQVTNTGNYSVFVTNASNCGRTSNVFKASTLPTPNASIIPSGPTSFCAGKPFNLSTDTNSGNTYQWKLNGTNIAGEISQKLSPTTSGNYSVLVTNPTGCSKLSSTMNVTINPLPPLPTITQNGNILTSSANFGNQWYKNDTAISGAIGKNLYPTSDGKYRVSVTDTHLCSSSSADFDFIFTGIEEGSKVPLQINIHPNPNNGIFNVEIKGCGKEKGILFIKDLTGKVVYMDEILVNCGSLKKEIKIKSESKGIYILEYRTDTAYRIKKIILE